MTGPMAREIEPPQLLGIEVSQLDGLSQFRGQHANLDVRKVSRGDGQRPSEFLDRSESRFAENGRLSQNVDATNEKCRRLPPAWRR